MAEVNLADVKQVEKFFGAFKSGEFKKQWASLSPEEKAWFREEIGKIIK